jgi:hypothetical protein
MVKFRRFTMDDRQEGEVIIGLARMLRPLRYDSPDKLHADVAKFIHEEISEESLLAITGSIFWDISQVGYVSVWKGEVVVYYRD